MLRHVRRLGAAAAIVVPLALVGVGTASAGTVSPPLSASAAISCSMNFNYHFTSPRPRLVNWTGTESCNSVIGGIAILSSTLYLDTGGQSFAVAEGTHVSQSASFQVSTSGSASPGSGGNYHVAITYQLLRTFAQGGWSPLPVGCFYYLSGLTIGIQCTYVGPEFTLFGDPTINQGRCRQRGKFPGRRHSPREPSSQLSGSGSCRRTPSW